MHAVVIWFQNNNISKKYKIDTFFRCMWKTYGEIQIVTYKGISRGKMFKLARHVAAWDQWLGRLIYSFNLQVLVTSKGW